MKSKEQKADSELKSPSTKEPPDYEAMIMLISREYQRGEYPAVRGRLEERFFTQPLNELEDEHDRFKLQRGSSLGFTGEQASTNLPNK